MSTRSHKLNKKSKTITRNTTCCNLFDSNELEFCCSDCRPKASILSLKRKVKKNTVTKMSIKQCRQP